MKFFSFLEKNSDAPFYVKKMVLIRVVYSAILYGCELGCVHHILS